MQKLISLMLYSSSGLILGCISSNSLANALEAEISALVQQEWKTIQQKKSIPSKLSDEILAITQHGLPKNLDERKAAVMQAHGLSVNFIAQENQGENLEKFLTEQGVLIQFRSKDMILAVTSSQVLKQVAHSPLLLSASVQGVVENQQNDASALLHSLNTTPNPNTSHSVLANPSLGVNDGVQATHAYLLHQKGYQGQGIKIGVIDFGFAYYPVLQKQNFLPTAKKVMTFANGKTLSHLNTTAQDSVHGTGTTEIIYKMAPLADFYLAQIGNGRGVASDGDVMLAID